MYAAFIIVLATATLVATILAFKSTEPVKNEAEIWLTDTFNATNKDTFYMLEAALGCCGTTGPESYSNTTIPTSCCPNVLRNFQNITQDSITTSIINNSSSSDSLLSCSESDAYQKGCVEIFMFYVEKVLKIVSNSLVWIAVAQYIAGFLAIFLACYVKN